MMTSCAGSCPEYLNQASVAYGWDAYCCESTELAQELLWIVILEYMVTVAEKIRQ